jgi:hypothetical protein
MDNNVLIQIGLNVSALLIPALVGWIIALVNKRLGIEGMKKVQKELEAKRDLSVIAVQFVEQAYKDLHGQDKYDKAAEWLSAQAAARGLQVTSGEIQGLIESTLRLLKDQFTYQWTTTTGGGASEGN